MATQTPVIPTASTAGNGTAFGVDVGGSGIKGALVDLRTGDFVGERIKILTPQPATPDAVAETIVELARRLEWEGPLGVTLPSVIRGQRALSAANIDSSWIGVDVADLFARHLPGREVVALNDADAAGLAEVAYGTEAARSGPVIFLTFGTGIGSAFLLDGNLFPNTEIGHMLVRYRDVVDEAEHLASSAAKDREEMSYKKWARRVSAVLAQYEALFNPQLFIVGGGISREHEKWIPRLENATPVIPATLRNRAGIVGAAMAVTSHLAP